MPRALYTTLRARESDAAELAPLSADDYARAAEQVPRLRSGRR
jgi:hypothetical protein